ncbi:MAG: hypothetical protein CMI08_19400 [Oceanospirillaceae bacterium]|nr:hypothetical protein [Oceanospirillaceae bacterium]MBS52298.1 hypothetical protein [Oceanospirillaceae bacterium]
MNSHIYHQNNELIATPIPHIFRNNNADLIKPAGDMYPKKEKTSTIKTPNAFGTRPLSIS